MSRIRILTMALSGLLLAIQLVPCRVQNPPVTAAPQWSSPELEALARQACYDCHSNEVAVPWYGYVAPAAWVVRHHVDEGRAAMNLSELDRPQEEAHEAGEEVMEGEMPPGYYRAMHADARLSDAQRQALAAELDRLLRSHGEHEEDDD